MNASKNVSIACVDPEPPYMMMAMFPSITPTPSAPSESVQTVTGNPASVTVSEEVSAVSVYWANRAMQRSETV